MTIKRNILFQIRILLACKSPIFQNPALKDLFTNDSLCNPKENPRDSYPYHYMACNKSIAE